jgi:hypothetical protein
VADTKITGLPENTTPATTDVVALVDDPGGTPASQKATLANLSKGINAGNIATGTLKHEQGGLEADVSAVTTGDVLAGSSAGVIGIVAALGKSDGDVLTLQADSTAAWETPAGGGSPGGADTQIQYNNGGAFGGEADLTWDDTGKAVTIGASTVTAQLKLPISNDAVTPTVAFGDGDTGFFESADDVLNISALQLPVIKVDGTVGTKGQVVLPQEDLVATPTLAFGNGDTGFYEHTNDQLSLSVGGTFYWRWNTAGFFPSSANSPVIRNVAPEALVPSICPNQNDTNSGIGASSADKISIIAGGAECARAVESGAEEHFCVRTIDAAASDGNVPTSFTTFYLDETANTLVFKAKYADGSTVKTGTVSLA